jgi:hypothetical protein
MDRNHNKKAAEWSDMPTRGPFVCLFVCWSYGTFTFSYIFNMCERIVAGHSAPWTQYIIVLVNFMEGTLSEICKALLY